MGVKARYLEVMTMRAVVVYESMYGNTHLIADAIGAGLRSAFDVTVVPVAEAGPAVLAGADLVVVGGPTHIHGMSRASTRKAAVEAADTRMQGPAAFTGRASKRVARLLRAHGFDVAIEPESFLVTKQDKLAAHESARAREWGARLAAGIAPSREPSSQG